MKKVEILFVCMAISLLPCYSQGVTDSDSSSVTAAIVGNVAGSVVSGVVPGVAGVATGVSVYSFVKDYLSDANEPDVSFSSDIYFSYFDSDDDSGIMIAGQDVSLRHDKDIFVTVVLTPDFKEGLSEKEIEKIKKELNISVLVRFESESVPLITLNSEVESYSINVTSEYIEYLFKSVVNDTLQLQFTLNSPDLNETKMALLYGMKDEADLECGNVTLHFE